MPRPRADREAASPTTPQQLERTRRILKAAVRLGSQHDLDSVRMADVARTAKVSLATLYRYYPTKHQLFAALMIESASALRVPPGIADDDRVGAVTAMMVASVQNMLARPRLSRAMIVSINAVRAESGRLTPFDLRDHIFEAARIDEPTDDDRVIARLIEQTSYGILSWAVMGEVTPAEAEHSMARACRLLLAPWNE